MRYNSQIKHVPTDRLIIFIGDSYGAGQGLSDTSQNWIDVTAKHMGAAPGLNSFSYKKSAVSGAGFIGLNTSTTFQKQLESITTVGDEKNLDVTDIVVGGGWNDKGQTEANLSAAMTSFANYCVKNYPYAKVWLAPISWCDRTKRSSDERWNYRDLVHLYSVWAGYLGWAFVGNIQYVMHNYNYFQSDGLHPNASGQAYIADHMVNALQGGTVNVLYNYILDSVTDASGVTANNPDDRTSTFLDNGICGMYTARLSYDFSPALSVSGNGDQWHDLFTMSDNACVRGGLVSELTYDCVCTLKLSDGSFVDKPCRFVLDGKKFQFSVLNTNGSGYTSLSVTRLLFNRGWGIKMWAPSMCC